MSGNYQLPFMQTPSGMGMNPNTGGFNMGMWGQQTPATASQAPYGSGIPFNAANGGFGAPGVQPQGWWDKIGGMEGFGQGVSAFSNLANIYAGFKSLGLAKDQFKFAKSSFNKNFNASAQAYNNELKDRWEQKKNIYESRGRTYEGMDTWMADRQIDQTSNKKSRNG